MRDAIAIYHAWKNGEKDDACEIADALYVALVDARRGAVDAYKRGWQDGLGALVEQIDGFRNKLEATDED